MPPLPRALAQLAARVAPYLPALVVSAALGAAAIHAILARAGHPALPLDDAFIHFQFARRLAEGAFFEYVPGEGYASGATSLLWPLLLAPFHLLGLRGLSLAWAAWALGTLAHAGVAVEAARLCRPLAGRAAAAGAGAMCLAFGAFAWFAWSGMETMAFAWILLRTGRVAARFCEPDRGAPPHAPARALELALLGAAAPLLRPEGALASLLAAAALVAFPRRAPRPRGRLLALVPLAGVLLVPALHLAFTGEARSTTAMVKWLIGNPSYEGAALRQAVWGNVQILLDDIVDGGAWTAVFLPQGARVPILLGLLALPAAAARRRRPVHAAIVAAIALGALIPCTYLSFLWNRLRYVWPFAPAWFVLVACLARELGDLAGRLRRALRRRWPALGRALPEPSWIPALLAGACAGALATRLPWALHDLAQSAHAIDQQQVKLGLWAAQHLPEGARIGVNDTGAIAYLSGRPTFDVVGLTTAGEARYWVAGAGSRFEHYERLPPDRRPTHFIVYPHWMACPAVLGRELTEATVLDQTILGGTTMVVYEARWDALGSGAAPEHLAPEERVLDDIDVADLESEAEHGYDRAGGHDQENRAAVLEAPEGSIADGGRTHRRADRFLIRAPVGPARLVLRVGSDAGAALAVRLEGQEIGAVDIPPPAPPSPDGTPPAPWVERSIELPAAPPTTAAEPGPRALSVEVELRRGAEFHAFHYWLVGRD